MVGPILLVLLAGLLANWGSYQDYRASQEALQQAQGETAALQAEVQSFRSRVARLQKDGYIEALARKELSYVRPGEEVYVVKGLSSGTPQSADEVRPEPGPVEDFILLLRRIF